MKRAGPVVITGFMGCGKSRVARELARRLNVLLVDLDERITTREGRTPAQLISEEGEPVFRTIETKTLRELLKIRHAGVIALGGGAWIEKQNRDLLNQYGCTSVWLDVPFEVCWSRIEASAEERPLGKTRDHAAVLYDRRQPVYELARIHIAVGADETFEDVVSRIEAELATD